MKPSPTRVARAFKRASPTKQELAQAFKQGQAEVERALKAQDIEGAVLAYEALSKKLHPLSKALDGVRLQRKEEQRKAKFLVDQLRRLGRLTSPNYLEQLAEPDSVTWYTVHLTLETLGELLPSILRLYDRIQSYQSLETSFKHGPFTIYNTYGYRPEEYASGLAVLDSAANAINGKGFGDILYGDVYLVGSKGAIGACGRYDPKRDIVTLNAECSHRFSNVHTMAHELGHRHWHKRLTPAQREAYDEAYSGTSSGVLTVADREDMWQAFQRAGYSLRGVGRYLKDPALLDKMQEYIKELRTGGAMLVPDPRLDWPEEKAKKFFIRPSIRFFTLEKAPPSSVTDYGQTSVTEDYAEVFAFYVLGKKLTPDAQARFEMAQR